MTQSNIAYSKSHITTYNTQSRKVHCHQRYRLVLPERRQVTFLRRSPDKTLSPSGATQIPESLFHGYRLVGHYSPPDAPHSKDLPDALIVWRPFLRRQELY
ncbi:hypothetical protein DEO72_LG2g4507 [Vigna unguiculata]|uniref:Uncharacterized protein n=1 Tax=Vigna unguiculata TaxID=3917 RepID=A0A4D6L6K9_VIGUN|nr:hypothetical protein DEO72_LG2g4507 [Vigna unguiculata]